FDHGSTLSIERVADNTRVLMRLQCSQSNSSAGPTMSGQKQAAMNIVIGHRSQTLSVHDLPTSCAKITLRSMAPTESTAAVISMFLRNVFGVMSTAFNGLGSWIVSASTHGAPLDEN